MPRVKKVGDLAFRFRPINGKILLTSDFGTYYFLEEEQFRQLVDQEKATPELLRDLEEHLLVLGPGNSQRAIEAYHRRHEFLRYGPNLHIFVVTLRCNTTCSYCHSSRAPVDAYNTDMSLATARRCVDMVFDSTSPQVTIEFQGGEPLLNWEVCQFILEYARERNQAAGKQLDFSLVTNLAPMTEEMLETLVAPDIHICTSIDGDELLHNKHRKLKDGNSFQQAVDWIRRINRRYEELDYDKYWYKVQALLTSTRDTLDHYKALVDTYLDLGMHVIHLRPMDPFGFAAETWKKVGYTPEEFINFYCNTLDELIERNKQGAEILEKTANLILMKLFSGTDPNFLDLRSPCGAAIGQLTYNYDGGVFTCDEGRMVHEMGDDAFLIGNVHENTTAEVLEHDTVRALAVASCLESQAECSDCAFNPFCGVCPVYNYVLQGDVFGQMKTNERCIILKGVFDYIFGKIMEDDPETMAIFQRWGSIRPPVQQDCHS
jgi:uncharacterized protein